MRKRIEALEAELRSAKRQASPFSRDSQTANPKKPGRKPGQGEFSFRQPPLEQDIRLTEYVPLNRCPLCGGELTDKQPHENIQVDIPRPLPVYTRFSTESGWCPHCRRRVRSRHSDQTSTASGAAGVCIGPCAKAVAADLHHRLGVPYAKIADHFQTVAGVKVTPGGLCQADERLAQKLHPVYKELIAALRLCCAVHSDETGWRIGILSAWLWVFTSREITVYVINESRGHEVVVEILGRSFRGVLIGNCFLAYDHKDFAGWIHQKCFAHFLKTLKQMEADKTRGAVNFPRETAAVLREALALRDEKPTLSAKAFAEKLRQIELRLDALIAVTRRFSDPDNRRFAKRLRKHRKHLFTFLTHRGVDATNNAAERMLRPAVIVRKTGACNKTENGATTHSVLASMLQTARQKAIDGIGYLSKVLTAPDRAPALLPLAPS
ncbi:MAG: IS66 family transposase [Planctomycetota bacterium]